MTTAYSPNGPYIFQSGKRQGKILELLMFSNPGFLVWLLNEYHNKQTKNKNSLHLHLEWLLQQGETRKAKMLCPFCGKKRVELLSIIRSSSTGYYSIDAGFSCCNSDTCKKTLASMALRHPQTFAPIKFSTVIKSTIPGNRKLILKAFRKIFGLSGRSFGKLTRQKAFEFFKGKAPKLTEIQPLLFNLEEERKQRNPKMKKPVETTWYIEPSDAHTNQVFSGELEPEDALREVMVFDCKKNNTTGKFEYFETSVNLWRCSAKKITALSNSKNTLSISFRIFSQEGKGKIRRFTPRWGKKRQQKPVSARAFAQ